MSTTSTHLARAEAARKKAAEAEAAALRAALAEAGGHLGRAAKALGISRATMTRRMLAAPDLAAWVETAYPKGERQPLFGANERQPGSGRKKNRPLKKNC